MKPKLCFLRASCFLAALATFTAGAADTLPGTGPSFRGPVGLQLYSLRDSFSKDAPGTIEKARAFGFKYVEMSGPYGGWSAVEFAEKVKAAGLKPISTHNEFVRWRDHPEEAAAEAKTIGLEFAGCPWIPHSGKFDEKTCLDAAQVFNRAGEVLAKQGIKFFYHPHGYEFEPYGDGTLFDLLVKKTNPKYVSFQMDVFWIAFPGQDPTKLLQKYGSRFQLMHLKDLKKGVQTGSLDPTTDLRNDVALGTGQIDWPSILKAAKKAGVKYYFIEDESPIVEEQIPVTMHYLETVKW
jgi:sugar phosphate isomerase/epimerase